MIEGSGPCEGKRAAGVWKGQGREHNHGWTRIDTDGDGDGNMRGMRRGGRKMDAWGGRAVRRENYRTDPCATYFAS